MTELEQVTHSALVAEAAKWLQKKGCSIVITELASCATEQPDAIGWKNSSIVIECKASRSDFLKDKNKIFRIDPAQGMGRLRYFLTLPGLVSVSELPEKWGLLERSGGKVRTLHKAEPFNGINHRSEVSVLKSALRRIGQAAPTGVSIKCYTMQSGNRATMGVSAVQPSPAPIALTQ